MGLTKFKKKIKEKNQNKGITLIALVVTIIVLLILAGVTIITLTSENGIINRTASAKKASEEAEIKENIRLAYANAEIERQTGGNEAGFVKVLKEDLEKIYGEGNVTVTKEGDTYIVNIAGKGKYQIDANGNISKKAAISLDKESVTVQIVDGTAVQETLTATIDGLEGDISWTIEGTEKSKFTLTPSADKKSATLTTDNDTEATSQDVTITVTCGGQSANCTAKIIRVVKVSSISSIEATAENGKINRGSNDKTITATVNNGATELLTWSVNDEYKSYVTISEPSVSGNNQTVTLTVAEGAPSGNVTITAQNKDKNLTANNTITLTVIIPVTGITLTQKGSTATINSESIVTIAPSGYADFVATVVPSDATDATNAEISWTITNVNPSGVITYPSSSSTATSTSGNSVRVTAGANTGTATIVATTSDGSFEASCNIKVARVVGHFKQVGTTAYYYSNPDDTTGTPITNDPSNTSDPGYLGKFLGMEVNYTPGGTIQSKNSSNAKINIGTSTKYRLFYVDVGGLYGTAGTIYLKADNDSNAGSLDDLDALPANKTSDVKSNLNKTWITSSYANIPATDMTYVNKLLDATLWEPYKDSETTIANYVVGAPTLEMWIDSYNAFLTANPVKGYETYNCTLTQDTETILTGTTKKGPVGANNGKGYYVGHGGNYTENSGWYTNSSTLVTPSSYGTGTAAKARVNMYTTGSSYYWLASPSAYHAGNVMSVSNALVNFIYYSNSYPFCPLVSCKSGVNISEK